MRSGNVWVRCKYRAIAAASGRPASLRKPLFKLSKKLTGRAILQKHIKFLQLAPILLSSECVDIAMVSEAGRRAFAFVDTLTTALRWLSQPCRRSSFLSELDLDPAQFDSQPDGS